MCLSALPMLAPSASAATGLVGENIVTERSPAEADLLDPESRALGQHYDIASDGTIYRASSATLQASFDDGLTFEDIWSFESYIHGVYIHQGPYSEYIFVSTLGEVYRSSVSGADFEKVLQLGANKYAFTTWSFSSIGGRVMIGEYGDQNTPAAVYLSHNDGTTWGTLFNTSSYSDAGAHIHCVAIDPYEPSTYYVNVGDQKEIYGLYISMDGGAHWTKKMYPEVVSTYTGGGNGFLSAVFPDPYRVIFTSDNYPLVFEYVKSTGELRLLTQIPNPYTAGGVKFYSTVIGQHGVIYFAGVQYGNQTNVSNIWLTIDGSSFYRVDHNPLDKTQYPLRAHGGKIYSQDMVINDLTREEAAQLIADGRRTVDMMFDSPRYVNLIDMPLKNVEVTVTGTNVINLIGNPSFEEGITGWRISTGSPLSTVLAATNKSRDGNGSIYLSQEAAYNGNVYYTIDHVTSGVPIYVHASISEERANEGKKWISIKYTLDGEVQFKQFDFALSQSLYIARHGWVDAHWVWLPPIGAELVAVEIAMQPGVAIFVDRIGVSTLPMWVPETTGSGNVSFLLGDHLIEAGELAEGESKTISLPSDVWLDGLVPIVPVTGLAYTVSIDGTPVSKSEQSIRETNTLLEQTIPLIVGLMVIGGLFTMLGKVTLLLPRRPRR